MQPACAQVSAKSILTGALKPKRVNSSLQYACPSVRLASIIPRKNVNTWLDDGKSSQHKLTWTVQSIKTRAYVQISTWIRVGTLLSLLPPVPERVRSVGLFGPTLSRAGLRSMAGLSPVNFPGTFPANFPVDLGFLITSQEWLERLMLAGQMNIRCMSGDWIASVCRLCARAPNYRPTILLRIVKLLLKMLFVASPSVGKSVRFRRGSLRNGYHIQGRQQVRKLPNPDTGVQSKSLNEDPLEGKSGASSRGNSSSNSLVVEPWDGSPGPPSVSTGRLVSSVGDTLLALTGRVVSAGGRTGNGSFGSFPRASNSQLRTGTDKGNPTV
ncbi:hypothetical protein YC2023_071978 [Brassica napus]